LWCVFFWGGGVFLWGGGVLGGGEGGGKSWVWCGGGGAVFVVGFFLEVLSRMASFKHTLGQPRCLQGEKRERKKKKVGGGFFPGDRIATAGRRDQISFHWRRRKAPSFDSLRLDAGGEGGGGWRRAHCQKKERNNH